MAYTPAEHIKSENKPILKLDFPKDVNVFTARSNSAWDLDDRIGISFTIKERESMKETLLYLAEVLESAAKQIKEQHG